MTASGYDPKEFEERWIRQWSMKEIFKATPDARKKFYLTVAYPYPSGSMHVGHGRTYTVPDVIARFRRMQGYNVLFPMAWHVTGSPVLGIAERLKKKDPKAIKIYGGLYKVPEDVLETFTDPENIVTYFSEEYRRNMTQLGFSIDWSRQFFTVTPQYSRFIEWQYKTLRRKDLVKKGEHPVRYCPGCDNPVGDHDLLEGENATINEFTVIKFRCGDMILPAATLRPETIFGVTNMWLNPNIDYLKARILEETWLLSQEAAEKLRYAGWEVRVLEKVSGGDLIGRSCTNPLDKRDVPILAASFVDPDYATGVVMSVPAHAPYDYIALRDLKSDIAPIVLIETDNGDAVPAKDLVEEMGIKNQDDKRLEEATEVLYRLEHAKGIMKESIEGYGGMPVREARVKVSSELMDKGDGGMFYEFSQNPVICRCGTRCYIKLLKDQWFLEYSNPEWKQKTHECLNEMGIFPEETRQNFSYFIDWLRDWACTRRVGLGTRLPWDDKWLIEPLSDSTIYMAYYTISRHLGDIEPKKLQPEFFDYVFWGSGDPEKIAGNLGLSIKKLQEIRKEFCYWYPPDWRLSAKDLVGNHLTFHIFHHTALFPRECWPKGIVVFGMGLLEGEKMSSSKGNIILLSDALEKYGSDTVRLFLMGNAEPWQDFDWRETLVKNTAKKLKQFYAQIDYALKIENALPIRDIDLWLISRLEESIKETTDALEGFQTRKALQSAFYGILNDLSWYTRRCEPNSAVLKEVVDRWLRLMAPFTPFVCEELWSKTHEGIVSDAAYPLPRPERIDVKVIQKEGMIKALMRDIQNILEATSVKPKIIHLYIAPEWKRRLFALIRDGRTIREAMSDEEIRRNGKIAAALIQKTRRDEVPEHVLTLEEEYKVFSNARNFLEREFKAKIDLQKTPENDPENKLKNALPLKPGIYIEG